MKKVFLISLLLVLFVSVVYPQQKDDQFIEREDFARKLLLTLYQNSELQNLLLPGQREKIRILVIRDDEVRMQRLEESNFSKQDSLIAFALNIDLLSENAKAKIQAMCSVIDQLAEQKADQRINDVLVAACKSFLQAYRKEDFDQKDKYFNLIWDIFGGAFSRNDMKRYYNN